MLLPAAATTGRIWRWQAEALAGRFTVLTPELPAPFTLDRAVAEVGRQLDDAPGPVHLCGISLSVTVAVLAALDKPERVRSLVLSGGIAHPPPGLALQRAIVAVMPQRLIARVFAQQIGRTIGMVPAGDRADMIAGCLADFNAIGKRTYRDELKALAQTDLRDRLAQLKVPTLVLCGARDKVNIPGSRELAGGIGEAELRIVPDAHHLWNLEHPDLFTRTLADFAAAH